MVITPHFSLDWREIESRTLAPYAVFGAKSLGRRFPEPEHPFRSPFQRDRDRIVHTNAFRRLEYKTQVFVNHEGDHYRTRLTHTIEVSLIARTLSRALHLNEDLAEAVALAHDLGHPPFGHSGETVLDDLMKAEGGFEHNVQSLRIVDELEIRYADFHGLNLTHEVREGLQKHSWFGPKGEGAPLEAQLCDLADPIAYDAHDVDDGLRSGLITLDEIAPLDLWRLTGPTMPTSNENATLLVHQHVRNLINVLVSDLLEGTNLRVKELGIANYADLRKAGEIARFSPDISKAKIELESFLQKRLYRHPRLTEARECADQVIIQLFNAYRQDPDLMPGPTRRRIGESSLDRVICDYVAGMTDRYALQEHGRSFGEDEAARYLRRMIASR